MEALVTTTISKTRTKVDEKSNDSNSFFVNERIFARRDGFLYPAKIIDMRRLEDGTDGVLVHYQGWNKKYDEWVEGKETCRKMTEENTRERERLLEEDEEKRRKANNNAAAAVGNKNKNKNDDEVKRKKNATTTKREKSQSTGKDGKKSSTKDIKSNTNTTTTTGGAKKKATSKGEGERQREPQRQLQKQKKRDLDAAATEAEKTTKEEDESEPNNATKKKAAPSGGRPSKKQKSEARAAAEQNAPPTTNKGRKGAVVNATNNTNKRKNAAALEKGAANAASKEKKNAKKDTAAAPTTNAKKQKQEKEKTETEEQRDRQDQQQQAPLKPKVKVILATALKKELIKQHEALAHNRVLKLPREPAAHTVQSLFSDYEVEAIAKARTPKQIERAKEIVAGLKRYFDAALQKALLYEKEKKYYDLAVAKNDALKSKPASEICGAEHLLRLYVKLPDFIPVEAFVGEKGEKEAQLIGHQLGETLRWLQKRSHEAFDGAYVEIDETSGKVIREIRKGAEVDDDDDFEDDFEDEQPAKVVFENQIEVQQKTTF